MSETLSKRYTWLLYFGQPSYLPIYLNKTSRPHQILSRLPEVPLHNRQIIASNLVSQGQFPVAEASQCLIRIGRDGCTHLHAQTIERLPCFASTTGGGGMMPQFS